MALPMFSTSYKADGPLGGFLAGLGDSFGLANADRDLADRDRKSTFDQLRLEEEQANTPVRAAKRAEELARSEFEQEQFRSGRKQELADAERNIRIEQAIAGKDENQKRQLAMQSEGMVKARAMVSDEDIQGGDHLLVQAKWDEAVKVAEAHGIKNMPKQFTMPAYQRLVQGAEAAKMTIPYLHQLQEQGFQSRQTDKKIESAERIAAGRDETDIKVANIRGPSATQSVDAKNAVKPLVHQLELKINEMIEDGEPVPESLMKRYISHAAQKDNDMQKQEAADASNLRTQMMSRPEERKKLAEKHGIDPNNLELIASTEAAERARKAVIRREMGKFDGAIIQRKDGSKYEIQDGEPVPLGGKAPAPKAAAAPAAPVKQKDPMEGQAGFGFYPGSGKAKPAEAKLGTMENPYKVATPEEASKLPSGSIFVTPNGKVKRVP